MKVKVYVVVTYHGGYGDDIRVFARRAEAVASVREYARDYWDAKRFGRFPRSYTHLCEAWGEHDLWGSTDSRWELEEREVEVLDGAVTSPNR